MTDIDANTFSGARIDRLGPNRADADWVAARLADPASRAVVATRHGVYLEGDDVPEPGPLADAGRDPRSWEAPDGGPLRPARIPLERALAIASETARPVLLGAEPDGAALFAVEGAEAEAPDGARLAAVRDAAARLDPEAAGLVAYATGMLNWHRRHRFCANCGGPTDPGDAGFVRVCTACGAHHHPRTDPVVIMLVVDPDGDRVLLGRQSSWPPGRYSALAGFVEPGEALEAAVAREVVEEAGVTVSHVRYVSSQPWPFPASLMLGFTARWTGGDPYAADAELDDARWFGRDEVSRQEGLQLPPRLAIARRLIEGWLAA